MLCINTSSHTGLIIVVLHLAYLVRGDIFTLGFIGRGDPKRILSYPPVMENSASAINIAIDNFLKSGPGPLHNHQLRIHYENDNGDKLKGVANVIDYISKYNVSVILGHTSTKICAPVGLILPYYNIPIFPHGCTSPDLEDKTDYTTLIRVNAAFNKMGKAFAEIFTEFNWTRVVMITLESGLCSYGADAIDLNFRYINVHVAEWIKTPSIGGLTDDILDGYLDRVKQRGRVVVICVDRKDRMNMLRRAYAKGMTEPDYVYIYYTLIPAEQDFRPWLAVPDLTQEETQQAKKALLSYKQVTMSDVVGDKIDDFLWEVSRRMVEPPWYSNLTTELGIKGNLFSLFLHDATYMYLSVLNETLSEGKDARDGRLLFEKSRGRIIRGISGEVLMDQEADREPNYWLWTYGPDQEVMKPWMTMTMKLPLGERLFPIPGASVFWGTQDNRPPPSVPLCGFDYELCPPDYTSRNGIIAGCSVGALFFIACLLGYLYIYRQRKLENELQKMLWRIDFKDVELSNKKPGSTIGLSFRSMQSVSKTSTKSGVASTKHLGHEDQMFTKVAYYKGQPVAIRGIKKDNISLSRNDLLELKAMREMSHENINPFIGACVDAPNICVLMHYCPKGSIQDILENDDINLDAMFKMSMISDVVNGLQYLHASSIKSHGNLRSTNCLVDGRWVVKITSYGLKPFRYGEKQSENVGEYEKYRKLLWTAPELLRMDQMPPYGTSEGDVYSMGIILQEIVFRAMPYFIDTLSPKEVVLLVSKEGDRPLRPECPKSEKSDTDPELVQLMQLCWAENPAERPSMDQVKRSLRRINKGQKMNIMDNMIAKLEKYANNLEEIVLHRTSELVEEKKKTDVLLYRMLPRVVAEQLKAGKTIEAELFDEVTIYFSDIVGFTSISSESTPMQVVNLLNDLYVMCDDIIAKHDVYKVETIGDAYMVVSGLPEANGDKHVGEIANMALDLLSAVFTSFRIRHRPDLKMKLRIGLHTGPCAAGVVGLTMPRYCLFGDTVNMASRMESNGLPLRIHLSSASYEALHKLQGYQMILRGEMPIKGKGTQKTYWLINREEFPSLLPSFDESDCV